MKQHATYATLRDGLISRATGFIDAHTLRFLIVNLRLQRLHDRINGSMTKSRLAFSRIGGRPPTVRQHFLDFGRYESGGPPTRLYHHQCVDVGGK